MQENLSAADQVNQIITQAQLVAGPEPTQEEQDRFIRGFSVGALVYTIFYYRAMKDRPLVWVALLLTFSPVISLLPSFSLSPTTSLIFFSALFILPAIIARRRSWNARNWSSFSEYKQAQLKWDRSGWLGLAAIIVLFFALARFVEGQLQSLVPGGNDKSAQELIQQLQENTNELSN